MSNVNIGGATDILSSIPGGSNIGSTTISSILTSSEPNPLIALHVKIPVSSSVICLIFKACRGEDEDYGTVSLQSSKR